MYSFVLIYFFWGLPKAEIVLIIFQEGACDPNTVPTVSFDFVCTYEVFHAQFFIFHNTYFRFELLEIYSSIALSVIVVITHHLYSCTY